MGNKMSELRLDFYDNMVREAFASVDIASVDRKWRQM